MRKLFLMTALASAALLSGCHSHHYHRVRERVYHLSDGSYAYQDNGFWLYLMLANTNGAGSSPTIYRSASSSSSLPAGGWAKGTPPSSNALKNAEVEEDEIVMNENGTPITPEEEANLSPSEVAAEAEAPAAAPAEAAIAADGGGGDGGAAQAQPAAPAEGQAAEGGQAADGQAAGGDAGGDGGGGGGDGGGGGGGD